MSLIISAANYQALGQVVPGLDIVIVPPSVQLTGAQSGILGIIGQASWGPVNTPQVFSGTADGSQIFGGIGTGTYNIITAVTIAAQQGVQSFVGVRVTDGTDTAAYSGIYSSASQSAGQVVVTAKYSGTTGNTISLTLSVNTDSSYKCKINCAALGINEVYDKIPGNTPAVLYANLVQMVNLSSKLVVLGYQNPTTPAYPTFPFTTSLLAGTDGSTLTSAMIVGQDGITRTGMYSFRKQPIQTLNFPDFSDSTQFSTIEAFAESEGFYAVVNGPSGQSDQSLATLGLGYGIKVMFGDWLYWNDNANGIVRLVSPSSFAAGEIASLAPNQSSLNKSLVGVIGSQRAGQASNSSSATFSDAEKAAIISAGYDLIANPSPGGAYWSCASGTNAAASSVVSSDSYTRMTNYLAKSLAGSGGMGQFIGKPITTGSLLNIKSALLGLLRRMLDAGYLDAIYAGSSGLPYSVQCDSTNNPQSQTSLGYVEANVQVTYEGIIRNLGVKLLGGSSVIVTTA